MHSDEHTHTQALLQPINLQQIEERHQHKYGHLPSRDEGCTSNREISLWPEIPWRCAPLQEETLEVPQLDPVELQCLQESLATPPERLAQ
mmetsp:Transcript_62465/g.72666  ORF Transcript_62465/g.72666 Transcript_62465/m.72666 type:complete len:90 (+) Transcript_62465:131-400(+)